MAARKKEAQFKWGPISEKQLQILTWWLPNSSASKKSIIVAEGSIRSGKTVPMSLSFIEWAFAAFNNELFGISGKTIGSLRQNVISPMKKILHGRGYTINDRRQEKILEVTKGRKKNVFELFGGKDEGSQDLIQGRTLAGFLADEVVLQPKSFINQGMARCSVPGSRIWFNCNPESPYHWFKQDIIDNAKTLNVFLIHFGLEDNLTLTDEIINRYKTLYTGVFYERFILGKWVLAEGIIYDIWDRTRFMDTILNPGTFKNYIAGIDYGTNNPCTFGKYGFDNDLPLYLVSEYWHDGSKVGEKQKTDAEYAQDFENFIGDTKLDAIYVDPSALSFITTLKRNKDFKSIIKRAKNDVLDGIRFVHSILHQNKYFVDSSCVHTDANYSSYMWDPQAKNYGEDKPMKVNDHACDRDRYVLYSHFYRKYYPSKQKLYK